MIRNSVLGLAGAVALISSANAADLYAPAASGPGGYKDAPVYAYDWSGFYVGAQLGGSWESGNVSDSSLASLDAAPARSSYSTNGVSGGALAGYNWQVSPKFVLGAEADFTEFDKDSTAAGPNLFANGAPVGSGGVTWNTKLEWMSTIRARGGYLFTPDLMVFATGGLAFGDIERRAQHAYAGGCPNCITVGPQTDTGTGFAAGGGVEYHISGNWLLRGEYLFADLDGKSITGNTNFPSATFHWNTMDVQTVRAALSYKFGSVYEPLK